MVCPVHLLQLMLGTQKLTSLHGNIATSEAKWDLGDATNSDRQFCFASVDIFRELHANPSVLQLKSRLKYRLKSN